jgi:hypothetical protein
MTDDMSSAQDAHRARYAEVMSEVDGLELMWPHAHTRFERAVPMGYVYMLHEPATHGNTMVYISWAASSKLSRIIEIMQKSNPRKLFILHVLMRSNAHNARTICETIQAGLQINRVRGNWFAIEDLQKILAMARAIDRLSDESTAT